MKNSILIILVFTILSNADFTRDDDKEIVTDNITKLQWDDKDYYPDDDDVNSEFFKNFDEAIDFCENSDLGGYNDWRLPNVNELKTIVNINKYNLAIFDKFKNTSKEYKEYWTSTSDMTETNKFFYITFLNGLIDTKSKIGTEYDSISVRCVRFEKE